MLSVLWVFPSWHFSLYSELTDSVSLSLSLHVCPSHSPSSCLSHSVSPSLSLLLLLSLSSSKAFLHFSQFSIFSFFLQKHTQVLLMTVFPPSLCSPLHTHLLLPFSYCYSITCSCSCCSSLLFFLLLLLSSRYVELKFLALVVFVAAPQCHWRLSGSIDSFYR